jgi:hypothetical protein
LRTELSGGIPIIFEEYKKKSEMDIIEAIKYITTRINKNKKVKELLIQQQLTCVSARPLLRIGRSG